MSNTIQHPYLLNNYTVNNPDNQEYLNCLFGTGPQSSDDWDLGNPDKIANEAWRITNIAVSALEFIRDTEEQWDKEARCYTIIATSARFLLELLPRVETVLAARDWIIIKTSFQENDWDKAICYLQKMNSSPKNRQFVHLKDETWRSCGIHLPAPRTITLFSSSVTSASWAPKSERSAWVFCVYKDLLSLAYFNRVLSKYSNKSSMVNHNDIDSKKDLWRAKMYASPQSKGMGEQIGQAIQLWEAQSDFLEPDCYTQDN
jgi:hypothetical protein